MAARFARVLEAEPATPSLLRRPLRAWLGEFGWAAEEIADLVLATDEAVSNVVDHAYLGAYLGAAADQHRIVEVCAVQVPSSQGRRIRIQIADNGRWRPAPATEGEACR